jgi:hypothetical protein
MAGQGARFGYRFKPFLELRGESFIEAAFAPFRPWLAEIAMVHFVITAEQEGAHDVRARLAEMFVGVPHKVTILPAATEGPAQTLHTCLMAQQVTGPILVCDCDHAVNVDALMRTTQGRPDIGGAVPTWSLAGEPVSSWSVAAVTPDGVIGAVAEKKLPGQGENFRGIIGCYYFADAGEAADRIDEGHLIYLSDLIGEYLRRGRAMLSVPVTQAEFFGDPARLARVAAR